MKAKNPIYEKLCRVFGNKRQQIIIFTMGSLIINLSYSIYNALLGITQKSVWFIAMGIYYAILSIMRMIAVRGEYKQDEKARMLKEISIMRTTGIMLSMQMSMICNFRKNKPEIPSNDISGFNFFPMIYWQCEQGEKRYKASAKEKQIQYKVKEMYEIK